MSLPRLAALEKALQASEFAGVAINPGPTLTYLTGISFHVSERPVIIFFAPGREPALVLPQLELLKVELIPYPVQAFPYSEFPGEWGAAFQKALLALDLDGKKIGVEPRYLRLLEYGYLKSGAPAADYADASSLLGSFRLRKDAEEVARMRQAVVIAQNALKATLPFIKIGRTEKEIAAELTLQLLRGGSDSELPFAPIVCAGPNSANQHATPSDRPLRAGDMLVIDWGAAHEGYISDLTRTFAIGRVEPEFEKIHTIVQAANAAGRAIARAGLPCGAVDKAAREVIERAGYGAYFTSRLGHGIGMEVHEEPYLRGDNEMILEPGMAATIEPGIYLPGRNGVRIEDDVIFTADGIDCLSDLPRELMVLG
jgi:Xaa-Pro dipeptidase